MTSKNHLVVFLPQAPTNHLAYGQWKRRGFWGNWTAVASCSTGQYLVAGSWDDFLYTSDDFGSSWVQRTASMRSSWVSVASSSNGSVIIAAEASGYLHLSKDYGSRWSALTDGVWNYYLYQSASQYWVAVASSTNGSFLAAAGNEACIQVSQDRGSSWTPIAGTKDEWGTFTMDR